MADARKIVWILGAGFSKPLGGPLLPDLLSRRSFDDIRRIWPRFEDDGMYSRIVDLYRWGVHGAKDADALDHALPQEHWVDAEGFLDRLDAAADDDPIGQGLRVRATPVGERDQSPDGKGYLLANLTSRARRLVAAECVAFSRNANLIEERWEPFVDWAGEINEQDTIVTFNYDRVVELVGHHVEHVTSGKRNFAPSRPVANLEAGWKREPGRAELLKLHGSVDWKRVPHPEDADRFLPETIPETEIETALCTNVDLFVATPGPSKRKAASHLSHLWTAAKAAIRDADFIVFIGFRFPPSDSYVRKQLLHAIGENARPWLRLHVVLGPELGNPDNVRMRRLLEFACERSGRQNAEHSVGSKRYLLHMHPLWGQDFLSLWKRGLL